MGRSKATLAVLIPSRSPIAGTLVAAVVLSLASPSRAAVNDIEWRSGPAPVKRTSPGEMRAVLDALGDAGDGRHVVVAFEHPVTPTQRSSLAAAGLNLQTYLGSHSYIARVSAGKFDPVEATTSAALVGMEPMQPVWKLHPLLAAGRPPPWSVVDGPGKSATAASPVVVVYVLFHKDVPLESRAVHLSKKHEAAVRSYLPSVNGLVIDIPLQNVAAFAREDAVLWIEPPLPRFEGVNDNTRQLTQVDVVQAEPQYGLDGSGVSVLVYDVGTADAGHPDFGGRLNARDSTLVADHSTHVAGTIGGSGFVSSGVFRGMAPGVLIESFGFEVDFDPTRLPLFADPGDLQRDYSEAINLLGVDVANNSIGTNICVSGFDCQLTGRYGVTASLIDSIVAGSLGRSIPIVWSNGNERGCTRCRDEGVHTPEGYGSIGPPAGAKNHITVGAINSNNDSMTPFSGWGPTRDGRLKPDIVAPGCQIGDDFGITSPALAGGYFARCGTSMATAAVTGLVALLIEDMKERHPDGPMPRPATFKATLTHNAVDLSAAGPDYQAGYGSVRIRDTIDFLRRDDFVEREVDHGQKYSLLVPVGPTDVAVKITLAWDDVPAVPNVESALVNDLDLRVYDPTGRQHFPWTLDPDRPALPAVRTHADHLNNIEQVLVDAPTPGLWLVQVFGYRVPLGPQTFSLCVTPTIARDCDTNGQPDDQEILNDPSLDCSGNGLIDSCEFDCDLDGVADSCEISAGENDDCNNNDIVDACDADCNANGRPDECDTLSAASEDCNNNGLPDECEPDCNGNKVADDCDLRDGTSEDCDGDGVPDECQDTTVDCNGNTLWDACETAEGTTEDLNDNGIPDECEERGKTIHVDVRLCSALSDGSPQSPFCNIQDGIDVSISGDEVVVGVGIYRGPRNRNLDFGGRAITLRSTDPTDATLVRRTLIDCESAGRGFHFHHAETPLSVIDGLTIRGGVASSANTEGGSRGGGIYCENSSPTIRNSIITGNTVGPSLSSEFGGAGIFCLRASPIIERCTISANTTTNFGGGVYAFDDSHPQLRECSLSGNRAIFGGGGIAVANQSTALLRNCAVTDNSTDVLGGGIYVDSSEVTILRSTVAGNTSLAAAGGIHIRQSQAVLDSSIVWNNSGLSDSEIIVEPESRLTVGYSAVREGQERIIVEAGADLIWAMGNIDSDPLFVDSDGADNDATTAFDNDHHLSAGSPCIDAGDPAAVTHPLEADLDGDDRVRNCRVDMGFDETEFFVDCNLNAEADACELADGAAEDVNGNGVPDECERCGSDVECDDDLFCNGLERCANGICAPGSSPCSGRRCDEQLQDCVDCLADGDCDDRDACTADTCDQGVCASSPLLDCGPTISLRAVAVNDEFLPGGPAPSVAVAPGDRVTCEVFVEGWSPRVVTAYQATIDSTGYTSAPRGFLTPLTEPNASAGAFINQGRSDFLFAELNTITVVVTGSLDYNFISVPLFSGATDSGEPVYGGTLILNVSDDAVGAFTIGFAAPGDTTFLNERGIPIESLATRSLTIRVPTAGCSQGPDCDGNGVWDACDLAVGFANDCDENDVPDRCDVASGAAVDCNGNLVPDVCEPDCNGNGVPDDCDIATGAIGDCNANDIPDDCEDCNENGMADECDLTQFVSEDCNRNEIPDECELTEPGTDCNANDVPDECDIATRQSADCNHNGVPDECDIADGQSADCNGNGRPDECEDCNVNGVADECDVADQTSPDCNDNGVPDECEDCNGNGVADDCDLATGSSLDCNNNDLPDECEDCNGNGIADECDIENGTSEDRDRDGVADDCDPCLALVCDDGLFCNGAETCEDGRCIEPQDPCANRMCDEKNDRCVDCLSADDCDDANGCTKDECIAGACRHPNTTDACDDGDRCTLDDHCLNGGCGGTFARGCGASIALRAVRINGVPIDGGPTGRVAVSPGDQLTCEIIVDGWAPGILSRYRATIAAAGYESAAMGTLAPLVTPLPSAGGLIDQSRPDFPFLGRATLTRADKRNASYVYESIDVFGGVVDPQAPGYGGTLILNVSEDAAGAFVVGFVENTESTFLAGEMEEHLTPLQLLPLVVSVPPPGCAGGLDCNENGVRDLCDLLLGGSDDCNANGIPDECDTAKSGASDDCTGNGIPDECEPDCNDNGTADSCDIARRTSGDCNNNGIPDDCEDCNHNSLADECEIAEGTQPDCNANDIPDECDIATGTSLDCTSNGIPDECEPDCNANGTADSCDIAQADSADADENGFPDECQRLLRVPSEHETIQDAIDAAGPGDVVVVADGTYMGDGNRELDFRGKIITVRSENGPAQCTIDAGGRRGFDFHTEETTASLVEGFTITGGQGIHCDGSSPRIRNCVITRNPDGGVACIRGSRPVIQNCTIAENDADLGAGVFCRFSSPALRNCTIVNNRSAFFGGGIFSDAGRPTIDSCILWGNEALSGDQIDIRFNSRVTVRHSDIEGGQAAAGVIDSTLIWQAGNIDVDPSFTASAMSDYRLAPASRCINAGDPDLVVRDDETDIDGDRRILFGVVDIGSDEATSFADCNANGIPDWKDTTGEGAADCNTNGVPDSCEDCNGNGHADECDLVSGASRDCNGNAVPDECEQLDLGIVSSSPPSGAIDAGQPFLPDGSDVRGWQTLDVQFGGMIPGLSASSFSVVREGGSGGGPLVRTVVPGPQNSARIELNTPAEPGTWTSIVHDCSNTRVRLGFLPGDVGGDGAVEIGADLHTLIDCVNDGSCAAWRVDLDRSGSQPNVLDITRLMDLFSGAGEYDRWAGQTLP